MLLPFDVAGYAKALAAAPAKTPAEQPPSADGFMQAGFHASNFFLAGPAGYDAAFSLNADDVPALDISYSKPIYVLFSGFAMVYHLGGPPLPEGEPVKELQADFPGIRRTILKSYVRYSFTRYGVTYVAAIYCLDRPTSPLPELPAGRSRGATLPARAQARRRHAAAGATASARSPSTARSKNRRNSPITARAISFPAPARTRAASAAPTIPSMRGCASRSSSARLRQLAILQQLGQLRFHRPLGARRQERRAPIAAA